jgi:hypothetical protein
MRFNRVAVSLLFVGAAQAGAQGADTTSRAAPTGTASASVANDATVFADPDTSKGVHRCWTACTGSLGRVPLSEWQAAQARRDVRELEIRRHQDPLAARNASDGPAIAPPPSRPLPSAPNPASGQSASTMSVADVWRYSIEEWRHAELEVADSMHHAVIVRLAYTFDSAQRAGVTSEEQLRILRQLSVIDHVNQLMWAERAWDVNRQADSAVKAILATP